MEQNKEVFPEIDVIPGIGRLRAVGRFIGALVSNGNNNHPEPETGASAMLDKHLTYIQGEWPFEV